MIEIIDFKGKQYPLLQTTGNAMRFAMPFAEAIIGKNKLGYDIGCKYPEWSYPNSILIDPEIDPSHDAMDLPKMSVDYIISSHCLEHLSNWVLALEHWHSRLKIGGILFLYLPNMDEQMYWRGWHNKKHVHYLNPSILKSYFEDNEHLWQKSIVTTGCDLNGSFYCIAEKI